MLFFIFYVIQQENGKNYMTVGDSRHASYFEKVQMFLGNLNLKLNKNLNA